MLHAAALNYFREVARIGSIRKAAGSLNVAASALNRQIINLEIQLGTPLFDRLPGSPDPLPPTSRRARQKNSLLRKRSAPARRRVAVITRRR